MKKKLTIDSGIKGAFVDGRKRSNRPLAQAQILFSLADQPAATIALLAERLGKEPPAVRTILQDLRRDGLVVRRSRGWILTDVGLNEVAEVQRLRGQMDENGHGTIDRGNAGPQGLRTVWDLSQNLSAIMGSVAPVYQAASVHRLYALSFDPVAARLARSTVLNAVNPHAAAMAQVGRSITLPHALKALSEGHSPALRAALDASTGYTTIARATLDAITRPNSVAALFDAITRPNSVAALVTLQSRTLESMASRAGLFDPALFKAFAGVSASLRLWSIPNRFDLTRWANLFNNRRICAAFMRAKLFPTPSMGMGLIGQIVDAYDAGESEQQLRDRILAYYDADDCAELAGVVRTLVASRDMASRARMIEETFTAHRLGLDTMTLYPLVPIVEGLLRPAIARVLGRKVGHNDIVPSLRDRRIAPVEAEVGTNTMTLATTYMGDFFFKSYAPGSAIGQPSDALPIRHASAHGDKAQGTRMETLACFLLLDVVVAILDGLRKLGLIP